MTYAICVTLDSYRKDVPPWDSYHDSYRALLTIRAVSRRHALTKALARAPETFRAVYYRAEMPEAWTLHTSAEIVDGGNV